MKSPNRAEILHELADQLSLWREERDRIDGTDAKTFKRLAKLERRIECVQAGYDWLVDHYPTT